MMSTLITFLQLNLNGPLQKLMNYLQLFKVKYIYLKKIKFDILYILNQL